jgi:hypothetical protein
MPIRAIPRLAGLVLALASSGCVIEARLHADASGRLALRYHLDPQMTLADMTQRLTSASVTVRGARVDRRGHGDFKVAFRDLTTLSTAALFRNVSVRSGAGPAADTTTVVVTMTPPKPLTVPESLLQYHGNALTLVVVFPGPIVESNAGSTQGATATWTVPLQALLAAPETVLSATYRTPASPG